MKIRDVWKSAAVLSTQLLALCIQIADITTYPGDKGEEQPAPEPQHLGITHRSLFIGVCFMEKFPVAEVAL